MSASAWPVSIQGWAGTSDASDLSRVARASTSQTNGLGVITAVDRRIWLETAPVAGMSRLPVTVTVRVPQWTGGRSQQLVAVLHSASKRDETSHPLPPKGATNGTGTLLPARLS